MDEVMPKFWTMEELPPKPILNDEIEQHFQDTHYRMTNGRYLVNLLFNSNPSILGDSAIMATFLAQLLEKYTQFMREYEDLGQMSRVDPAQIEKPPTIYLTMQYW